MISSSSTQAQPRYTNDDVHITEPNQPTNTTTTTTNTHTKLSTMPKAITIKKVDGKPGQVYYPCVTPIDPQWTSMNFRLTTQASNHDGALAHTEIE